MFKIGNIEIKNKVCVAPMAGITDLSYRLILKEMGAALLTTELVSAKGIYYNNPGTIAIDEKWSYIGWGTAIGAISWLCILYDNDERSFDARGFDRGGCVGGLMLIGLFIFYWIYKFVRLVIDGIKS